jgi:hypothetical protein
MVGGLVRKNKKERNKLSTKTFHWAWTRNILQIKGNQASYQTKGIYNDDQKNEVDNTKKKYSSSNDRLCKVNKKNTWT